MTDRMITIGLMSGTSMDGIDAALLETDGQDYARLIAGASCRFSPSLQGALTLAQYVVHQEKGDLLQAEKHFSRHLADYVQKTALPQHFRAELEHALGVIIQKALQTHPGLADSAGLSCSPLSLPLIIDAYTLLNAQLIERLLADNPLYRGHVRVIGFHGQTLYHRPAEKISLQVGHARLLAEYLQIPVVHHFRDKDVQAGGQGAPFAPLYHRVLALGTQNLPVAIINCGGIANITVIPEADPRHMIGFDTGPGNVLIDRLVRQRTAQKEWMDRDGHYGREGRVHGPVIEALKTSAMQRTSYQEDFLKKNPPKSLDSQDCVLIPELEALSLEDACATLAYFTVYSIVQALDLIKERIAFPKQYVLAGGGWNNPVIHDFFTEQMREKYGYSFSILKAQDCGWSSTYMEAEIFAYLALRAVYQWPLSFPNITGVPEPLSGGTLVEPQGWSRR